MSPIDKPVNIPMPAPVSNDAVAPQHQQPSKPLPPDIRPPQNEKPELPLNPFAEKSLSPVSGQIKADLNRQADAPASTPPTKQEQFIARMKDALSRPDRLFHDQFYGYNPDINVLLWQNQAYGGTRVVEVGRSRDGEGLRLSDVRKNTVFSSEDPAEKLLRPFGNFERGFGRSGKDGYEPPRTSFDARQMFRGLDGLGSTEQKSLLDNLRRGSLLVDPQKGVYGLDVGGEKNGKKSPLLLLDKDNLDSLTQNNGTLNERPLVIINRDKLGGKGKLAELLEEPLFPNSKGGVVLALDDKAIEELARRQIQKPQLTEDEKIAKDILEKGTADFALQRADAMAQQQQLSASQRTELIQNIAAALRQNRKPDEADNLLVNDAVRRLDADVKNEALSSSARSERSFDYAAEILHHGGMPAAAQFLEREAQNAQRAKNQLAPDKPEAVTLGEFSQTAAEMAKFYRNQHRLIERDRSLQRAMEMEEKARTDIAPFTAKFELSAAHHKDFVGEWQRAAEKLINPNFYPDDVKKINEIFRENSKSLRTVEALVNPNAAANIKQETANKYQEIIKRFGSQEGVKDVSLVVLKKGTIKERTKAAQNERQPFEESDIAIAVTRQINGKPHVSFTGITENGICSLDNLTGDDILLRVGANHVAKNTPAEKIETIVGTAGADKKQRYDRLTANYFSLTNATFEKYQELRGNASRELNGMDLKYEIGYALGFKPNHFPQNEEQEQQVKSGNWHPYNNKEREEVDRIEKRIRLAAHGDENSTAPVTMAVLPVFHDSEESNALRQIPLFRVETGEGRKFVEPLGKQPPIFSSFEKWENGTQLPKGRLSYFRNGEISGGALPDVVRNDNHKNSIGDIAWQIADIGVTVVGFAATIASFFPPATPIALPIAGAAAGYGAARAGVHLYERADRQQSLSLLDADARAEWFDLIANGTGVAAVASSLKAMQMASKLNTALQAGNSVDDVAKLGANAARWGNLARTTGLMSQYADTAAMGNMGYHLADNWERLSTSEKMMMAAQMGFWGGMTGVSARQAGGLKNLYGVEDIGNFLKNVKTNAREAGFGQENWLVTRQDVESAWSKVKGEVAAAAKGELLFANPLPPSLGKALGHTATFFLEKGVRAFGKLSGAVLHETKTAFGGNLSSKQETQIRQLLSKEYRIGNEMVGRTIKAEDAQAIAAAHSASVEGMPKSLQNLRNNLTNDKAREAFDVKYHETVANPRDKKQVEAFEKYLDKLNNKSGLSEKRLISAYEKEIYREAAQRVEVAFAEEAKKPRIAKAIEYHGEDKIRELYSDFLASKTARLEGKSYGTQLHTPFEVFIGSNRLSNSTGKDGSTLAQKFPGFENLSGRKQNDLILADGNPILWRAMSEKSETRLPQQARKAVEDVLNGNEPVLANQTFSFKSGRRAEGAREELNGKINEALGRTLTKTEFENYLRLTHESANIANSTQIGNTHRGSVGEHHFSTHYLDEAKHVRKPFFHKDDYDPAAQGNGVQPDDFLTDLKMLVNIKTGVDEGLKPAEVQTATKLLAAIRSDSQIMSRLKERVEAKQGDAAAAKIPDEVLSYSYVFQTNGKADFDPKSAAQAAYKQVGAMTHGDRLLKEFRFFYVDKNGSVHEITGPSESKLVGNKLTDAEAANPRTVQPGTQPSK